MISCSIFFIIYLPYLVFNNKNGRKHICKPQYYTFYLFLLAVTKKIVYICSPQTNIYSLTANIYTIMSNDIDEIIAGGGIVFKSGGQKENSSKVKTKAKKKKYITGAHGSGSARQKAKYREQRANRNRGKK